MATHAEKKSTKGDGTGLHLVMNTGSGFSIARAGADVLNGWAKFGDVIQPGSAVAAKLIAIADTSKGLKLNKELRRLHEKAGGDPLGGIEGRSEKKPLQLPAGTLEDQMAQQLGGFVSKGQAAQKAVDAQLLAAAPFPTAKGVELLDLDYLLESPKNPRQDFDEEGIEELARSIVKTGGLMVPILARPMPRSADAGHLPTLYEIADGARRYRALQLLKKQKHELGEKALVDIRPLTDAQLAEAFMTADKRKTLAPIEQARGFKNMLDVGHSVDTIASSLGVSKGTVHGRLKLLELGKKAAKYLAWGTLPSALATVIGRYPEQLQDEALDRLLGGDERHTGAGEYWVARDGCDEWSDDPKEKVLLAGACIEWLQENFTRSLKSTPFDQKADDVLVPKECWPDLPTAGEGAQVLDHQVVAPACGVCPKNSRNMAKEVAGEDTRGDGKSGFCTGLACYQAKWDATLAALRAKAKQTGELKVLTPAQSAKALKNHYQDAPYAKASEKNHNDPKGRTWGELRDEANKKLDDSEQLRRVIATTEEGKTELVERAEVLKVLAGDGVKWAKKEKADDRPGHNYAAAQAREREKAQLQRSVAAEVLKGMIERIRSKGATLPLLRAMAECEYGSDDELELFGVKSQRDLETFIEKKATLNDLLALLYVRITTHEYDRSYGGFSDEVERAAAEQKIDLKKRMKEAAAAVKAAEKQAAGEKETLEEGDE